jgi:hypothetical protein
MGCQVSCRHEEGAQHDCIYVEARNALIPAAEAMAHNEISPMGLPLDSEAYRAFFGTCFLKAMDVLWSMRDTDLAFNSPGGTA